ncbi:MAG: hypothetical protein L0H15_10540 [Nitrosospira sp.]|nr:hypothetical protein [Nitrosospira sp.]MDN5881990.1 hypothetical protein [Nitrosospira sp.]
MSSGLDRHQKKFAKLVDENSRIHHPYTVFKDFCELAALSFSNAVQAMHATCIDIDATAVHMAYVQLTLLHIPAIAVHGNALPMEQWGYWLTPAHVLGFWDAKLKRGRAQQRNTANDHLVPAMPDEVMQQVREVAAVQKRTGQLTLF